MPYILTQNNFLLETDFPARYPNHTKISEAEYWRAVKAKSIKQLAEFLKEQTTVYYILTKTPTAYRARFFMVNLNRIVDITLYVCRAGGGKATADQAARGLRTQSSLDVLDTAIMNCGFSTHIFTYERL